MNPSVKERHSILKTVKLENEAQTYPARRDESLETENPVSGDYSFVAKSARIAVYDDMRAAPRMVTIEPAPTDEFIEQLASTTYRLSQEKRGAIPYTAIREVTENFIHAAFNEIVVSILDGGNTIRFADQGPGIEQKDKAQLPGFTSATEPMKRYIRGVGSGLPIVGEYMRFGNGSITIEDNLTCGSVVTLRLGDGNGEPAVQQVPAPRPTENRDRKSSLPSPLVPHMTERGRSIVLALFEEGVLGVSDLSQRLSIGASSVFNELRKLEEEGVVERLENKKRMLTDLGTEIAISIR